MERLVWSFFSYSSLYRNCITYNFSSIQIVSSTLLITLYGDFVLELAIPFWFCMAWFSWGVLWLEVLFVVCDCENCTE